MASWHTSGNPRTHARGLPGPREFRDELEAEGADIDPMAPGVNGVSRRIADRESEYHARRHDIADAAREDELERETQRILREIEESNLRPVHSIASAASASESFGRPHFDAPSASAPSDPVFVSSTEQTQQQKQQQTAPRKRSRWDEAPKKLDQNGTSSSSAKQTGGASRWDKMPETQSEQAQHASSSLKSQSAAQSQPLISAPPLVAFAPSADTEMEIRNRYLTDEQIDALLPETGYTIIDPPPGYQPTSTRQRPSEASSSDALASTANANAAGSAAAGAPASEYYFIPDASTSVQAVTKADKLLLQSTNSATLQDLPSFKQDDLQFFAPLLDKKDESMLSPSEIKERRVLRLLLKIKNGTPPMRKTAMRAISEKARELGPAALFNQLLPLLMSPSLEDQERHLLVKVIDRVLHKLDDLVRPFVHRILVVIEPLLIDEDYYARVEGREIISNLAKAAGLATMILTMRPDIDHADDYVRNTTARAFAVVACALGIPALVPFLRTVCRSVRSWQARHTGAKIIQQIALLIGCGVLPHLNDLVEALAQGLRDEHQKVRIMTALAIAALAEAAHPYGIESFDPILEPLFEDVAQHRGKALSAFLKAIGSVIPLMEATAAMKLTQLIMPMIVREFKTPDDEMKFIVLRVVRQCAGTEGVDGDFLAAHVLPSFYRSFWVRRTALDRRLYRQLVETTVELARKTGAAANLSEIVLGLKDEGDAYRNMVMETIEHIVTAYGVADVDERLEQMLIDGALHAFQEQKNEDVIILNGFGTIVSALGTRVRPYLDQICSTIRWRLNNKYSRVRQHAADLVSRVAAVLQTCGEEKQLAHLGTVLYEYLGEEYPEVLGSILGALKAIVNVIGMPNMSPPIKDLLPRLTPILRNRHEKVQENVIDLVGRIADRGAEFVSPREWMRICFELLDMLKAHKKAIRRATVNTFGYIAKAIGPQDVLSTLLKNLKVQERQNRVCTTVAIAIVAETCSPFTVIPWLMCEYRVPELNVQNGVLKSLSFLFEYIGEMGKDYVYSVTPLLTDALIDRDLVHRQTACSTVKHIALGVAGLGCEDALLHLLNHVWPNIFETSPHVINAVCDAIEGLRVALGPGVILNYVLAGLFHPARRVREIFWKVYNSLNIASQEALVPYYPPVASDSRNHWERTELLYF